MCIPKWVVDRRLGSVTYTRIENLFLGGMKDKKVNKDRNVSHQVMTVHLVMTEI